MSSFAPKLGTRTRSSVGRARRHLRVRKKVTGTALRPRLVVTRSADFGLEQAEQAQDISTTGQVLGALSNTTTGQGGLIRVAVLGGGNAVGQLNDDSYFDFTATSVTASQIDTLDELNNYDVVMMTGDMGRSAMSQIAPALRQWVEAGHGVVGSGWTVYYAGQNTGTPVADIDAIIPINLNTGYSYNYNPTLTIVANAYRVADHFAREARRLNLR